MLFDFELCRILGILHPDHLFERLTHRQYIDWQLAYELEPWGEFRADLRMARTAWAIRGGPDESKYLFHWKHRQSPAPQTADDYRIKAMRVYANQGGLEVAA